MSKTRFEWDKEKEQTNLAKHGVSFTLARLAFLDPSRVIAEDAKHSTEENRYYCIGVVEDGILTVRFTFRPGAIRIIGAGYWRKGKQIYENQNPIHP